MNESGSATIYGAIVITVGLFIALGAFVVTGFVRVHHQAHNAADLAALAATTTALDGHDGCVVAQEVATKNQARLTTCEMFGVVATITVETTTSKVLGMSWTFTGISRAAPVDY